MHLRAAPALDKAPPQASPGAGSEPAGFGEDIALLFDGYLAMGTRSGQASGFVALGKMVGPPDGWYFCNLVGTGAADRKKMLGAAPGWRDL